MPETEHLVINTGPLIALFAAVGDYGLLRKLYREVRVPCEVCQEMLAEGGTRAGGAAFQSDSWLKKESEPMPIAPLLLNSLDRGEASVIQLALNKGVHTVCIDEPLGRRVARLSGLAVTGTVGMLLRAKREGHLPSIRPAIERMRARGIWLSDPVLEFALRQAKET